MSTLTFSVQPINAFGASNGVCSQVLADQLHACINSVRCLGEDEVWSAQQTKGRDFITELLQGITRGHGQVSRRDLQRSSP